MSQAKGQFSGTTQTVVYDEFPKGPIMEFRLVYEGPLRASTPGNNRAKEKHHIRRQFHKQLVGLWKTIPHLRDRREDHWNAQRLGDNFNRCGYKFVPLVNQKLLLGCGLDILFLRRDMPGIALIQ